MSAILTNLFKILDLWSPNLGPRLSDLWRRSPLSRFVLLAVSEIGCEGIHASKGDTLWPNAFRAFWDMEAAKCVGAVFFTFFRFSERGLASSVFSQEIVCERVFSKWIHFFGCLELQHFEEEAERADVWIPSEQFSRSHTCLFTVCLNEKHSDVQFFLYPVPSRESNSVVEKTVVIIDLTLYTKIETIQ